MLELDAGGAEALHAFLQELECEVRFIGGQFLAHTLDENCVV
jgi:hypothetical protein